MPLHLLCCTVLLFLVAAGAGYAREQDSLRSDPRSIDLNEHVVRSGGLQKLHKRSRISDVSLIFGDTIYGRASRSWDSNYLLTRFPSPGSKRFRLVTVEGRIGAFDTSKFRMVFVVLQLQGSDTLFREIPVEFVTEDRPRQRHLMRVADHDIILEPLPFYMGYGFYKMDVRERYSYRLYATMGGSGALLRRDRGWWRLIIDQDLPYVFPFKITYLERQ